MKKIFQAVLDKYSPAIDILESLGMSLQLET